MCMHIKGNRDAWPPAAYTTTTTTTQRCRTVAEPGKSGSEGKESVWWMPTRFGKEPGWTACKRESKVTATQPDNSQRVYAA
jgi:hypothetical protein